MIVTCVRCKIAFAGVVIDDVEEKAKKEKKEGKMAKK